MNRLTGFGLLAALALLFGGCVDREAQKQAKQTEAFLSDPVRLVTARTPETRDLVDTVEVTGEIATSENASVGPKAPGKLVAVYVQQGDLVSAGQTVAMLDTSLLIPQLEQAQAGLQQALSAQRAAQAQLSQTITNAQVNPRNSTEGIRQAEAGLAVARAQLQLALNGARTEERTQAEAQLTSARANLANVEKQYARVKRLVAEGALAQSQLDALESQLAGARAAAESAQQTVNITRSATRPEQIQSARAQVAQAEAALRTARQRKELDSTFQDAIEAARSQVASTAAGVRASQATIQLVTQQLNDATIKAPFAGRVVGRPLAAGTVVGAGTAVVQLVGKEGVFFSAKVPANLVQRLQPGQPVDVQVDGLPGRKFSGTIGNIGPSASAVGRQVEVRVNLADVSDVKPGMFARGTVSLSRNAGAMVIPVAAVLSDEKGDYVYIVDGSKAKRVAVTTGQERDGVVEVRGLAPTMEVIVQGQTLISEGSQVRNGATQASEPTKQAG